MYYKESFSVKHYGVQVSKLYNKKKTEKCEPEIVIRLSVELPKSTSIELEARLTQWKGFDCDGEVSYDWAFQHNRPAKERRLAWPSGNLWNWSVQLYSFLRMFLCTLQFDKHCFTYLICKLIKWFADLVLSFWKPTLLICLLITFTSKFNSFSEALNIVKL